MTVTYAQEANAMPVGPVPMNNTPPLTGEAYFVKDLTVPAGGVLYVNKATVGYNLIDWPTVLIQADAAFAIACQVSTSGPWGPYPGTTSGAGNAILLFRGRWDAFRVTAAAGTKVYVRLDRLPLAWS